LDQLRVSTATKARATNEMKKLKGSIGQIVIPQSLLDQAGRISDLYQRLGSHRKGLQDRGRLQGNIQQLSQDIEILLSEIRPDADIKEYIKLRPNVVLRAKVQDLGSKYQALLEALDRATKDITKLEKEFIKAKSTLQSLEAHKRIDTLKSAVSRARNEAI